jgi:hypothetical protein
MTSDGHVVQVGVDYRTKNRANDCFDCIVGFPAAIEQMRADCDDKSLPQRMIAGTRVAFDALEPTDLDDLILVAASAQDLLYRYIMQISILDHHTRAYCNLVVRYFFSQLSVRGIRTYYILDNTLREDRFQLVLELFELVGIETVTPRRDGVDWSTLSSRILSAMSGTGHVLYVEPDAQVDHLVSARKLADQMPCIATYRALAPDDPVYTVLRIDASRGKAGGTGAEDKRQTDNKVRISKEEAPKQLSPDRTQDVSAQSRAESVNPEDQRRDKLRSKLMQYPGATSALVEEQLTQYDGREEQKSAFLARGFSNALAEASLDRANYPRPLGWHSVFFYPGSMRLRNVTVFWIIVAACAAWIIWL